MLAFAVQCYLNASKVVCRCVIIANLNNIWVLDAGGQLSECQHDVATLIDLPEVRFTYSINFIVKVLFLILIFPQS